MKGGSNLSLFLKTIAGVLAISIVISGITLYLTKRREAIVYNFDPENAYVYTFNRENFRINYENYPKKSVTLLSDGFSPFCLFGCEKNIEEDELTASLVQGSPGSADGDNESDPRFVYLPPGESLELEMDMAKGDSIRDRFPYSNRLILELKAESDLEDLNLKVYGYPFEDGEKEPGKAELHEEVFTYSGDFGKSSVFVLSSPYYVARVQFEAKEGSEGEIGLRESSLYLERNEFVSTVSRLKSELSIDSEEKAHEREMELKKLRTLDPYSPTTDYLLAEVYSRLRDNESAMSRIDLAISYMETYSDFLVPRVDYNDLYKRKARIASKLEEWGTAIQYMAETSPEVDNEFLSEAYLNRYLESENTEDMDSSLLNAVLAYQDKPRLILEVLRRYSEKESWLDYGLNYFSERVQDTEEGSYRLENDRQVSPYLVNLSVALLELWRGGEGSVETAEKSLTIAEESTDNSEKMALINAVKSRLYRSEGEEVKADESAERALEYFSSYSSLYDEWIGFVKGEGR